MSSGDCIKDRAIQSTPSSSPFLTFFLSADVNAEFSKTVSGKFIPFLLFNTPSKITFVSILFLETFYTFSFILPSSINIGWFTLTLLKIFSSGRGTSLGFKFFLLFTSKSF